MNARIAVLAGTALALLLSACASGPARPPAAPLDPLALAREQQVREALVDWGLSGRVAISSGGRGGNARLDWRQRGDTYEIALSAPVTRQSWRLVGDGGAARLEGVEGGPRESADVEALLFEATGWDIPVRALVAWVRGVPAPGAGQGRGQLIAGSDGRPARLLQAGWDIEYRDWHAAAGDRPALPRRIEARRGEARVRLLVDDWSVATPVAIQAWVRPADDELADALAALRLEDPEADLRERIAAGDLRPVAVCGFACLVPGLGEAGQGGSGSLGQPRILDGSGDVVLGERHLALKRQAEAYAAAYNRALAAWRQADVDASPAADP